MATGCMCEGIDQALVFQGVKVQYFMKHKSDIWLRSKGCLVEWLFFGFHYYYKILQPPI